MSAFTPFPYPCKIVRATAGTVLDDYGNQQNTYGTVDTFCDLQQAGSQEPGLGGEASITTWNLYLPVDAELDTGDAVKVNGETYQLTGTPWVADTGSAAVDHIEAVVVSEGQG